MLKSIISFSIRNKLIVLLFTFALIGWGSYQFTKLPIDAVPDITNNQVQVITVAPALGATDIERLVTFPIEIANSNIEGIHEIRSFSRFGLSLVTIVFDDDIDVYWARQQVSERIQQVQADLPDGIGSVSLGPVSTGLGEIYQYTLRTKPGYEKKYDETELRTIQDWVVRRQLLGVKGVADVSSFGGKLKQFEIAIDPAKLKAANINMNDVFEALANNNQNTGGAYIEKGPTVLYIRSEGLIGSKQDLESIFIRSTSLGTPLLMRDIADIQIGHATRYGALCYNDEGEVAGAIVMMLKGANSSEVIKNVKERVAQIQKTLPEGVILEPFLDRTKMVNNAIGTVETNLLEGALIVLFVLIVFLGNLRAGFIVASVIPLAMLFAIILMNQFGVIGNLMSLGALDFGLIVDGAVFIVEAVLHQLHHSKAFGENNRLNQNQMDEEVNGASSKMARSVVFGQLIILIVYLPTFALQGIEGKMFIPMAQTVSFALLGAFILSITYVPMMSALLMSRKKISGKNFSDNLMAFFEKHVQSWLAKVIDRPKTVLISAALLFSISIFVLNSMGGEFIPALEEGDFAVETRVLTGSSLSTTIENTQKAAGILKAKFPEIEQVVTKIGSGEIPTDPMPMEASDMMIILKDKKEWTSAKSFQELADKMSAEVATIPGVTTSFQFPVQMRFNELMTGAKQDVVCKIFGENLDTLAHYAKKLGDLSSQVDGTKNLYIEPVNGMPQITINFNRNAIAQYGLNIAAINRIINTGLAGQSAGYIFEGEKKFELVLRLKNNQRKNLEDVRNLLIPTPDGIQIPLYQLAEIEIKDGPNQIQREDAKRRIVVGFNVRGRDVQSIVEDLKSKVDKKLKLPPGYYISYGGAFENLNAAKARLAIAVPIALLLIFLLLYFSFGSVKQSLLIYSAIPLSAIGGIFALYLRGMPFSISAGVGFIALFGVAVLNGIVLIAEFNRLKKDGYSDPIKIVLEGTRIRLRPVLMTAFVASFGFLPMALSTGAGAEVQRPLATVVIGGLLIATLLTIFVLPILYLISESKQTNGKGISTLSIFMLFFLSQVPVSAQTKLSLKEAIDTAAKNNLSLKASKLNADAWKELKRNAFDVEPFLLLGEYGQINSAFNDSKFSLNQSFKFPSVYKNQKQVNAYEWENAELSTALQKALLTKEVSMLYSSINYLNKLLMLTERTDSIYEQFEQKALLRFNHGDNNVLEKNTALIQRGQLGLKLMQLKSELNEKLSEFNLLLNAHQALIPEQADFKFPVIVFTDSATNYNHPFALQLKQNTRIEASKLKLEKSSLLPNVFVGYSNGSIRGTGADDVYYPRSTRFQSVQAGIGIPLFYQAPKARIQAQKLKYKMALVNESYGNKIMDNQLYQARIKYNNALSQLNYYETAVNPNSRESQDAAQLQFDKGEINYLEWAQLMHQLYEVQAQYLSAIQHYNESIIELNYLQSK